MCIDKFAKLLILLILLPMLAIAPVSAFGRESVDLATPSVPPAHESESGSIEQEIKAFTDARISARRAIAIAQKRGAGAKVVELSFDGSTSHPAYGVKVLQG